MLSLPLVAVDDGTCRCTPRLVVDLVAGDADPDGDGRGLSMPAPIVIAGATTCEVTLVVAARDGSPPPARGPARVPRWTP